MIEIKTRIHDRFSIEFKIGFVAQHFDGPDDFSVYMWVFIPNSLDINAATYPKAHFYRDVKSNVRLITPRFRLASIVCGTALPLHRIEEAFRAVAAAPTHEALAEYEYQIKMFAAIVKSSLRAELGRIRAASDGETAPLCRAFVANAERIAAEYRALRRLVEGEGVPHEALDYHAFGDEFISGQIEGHALKLMRHLDARSGTAHWDLMQALAALVRDEAAYRRRSGCPAVRRDDPQGNRQLVFRHGVLKKYIESDLFLRAPKKRDGVVVEQLYYSIAAGLSMIFATVVSFSFQRRFGNFTAPLFIALVVSYMLKDRIKELMRYYFAHRIGSRYFDNKATISIKEQPIGWMKEGVDFISDDRVPEEVMQLRSRSPLLEAENRLSGEQILLYRKSVHIDRRRLEENKSYPTDGINDIVRLHLNSFIQKMDDPEVPLLVLDDGDRPGEVLCAKCYFLNIVVRYRYGATVGYKRFRIAVSRAGIADIVEMA